MKDLIDRQATMKEFADFVRESNNSDFAQTPTWNDAVSLVGSMPSAEQWIPCSERLPENPENDDYYLVSIQCEHYDGWDDYVTGFAEWTKHGWDELSCYIGQIKVVAWMPLPEPYKEG